jgi:hypothetical protein
LAETTGEVALPAAFAVALPTRPATEPLAPLPGAVNVTTTPLRGLLPASVTFACRVEAKTVLIVAFCGVPPVGTIAEADPARFDSAKLAGVPTPAAAADTVNAPALPFAVKTADVATPAAFVVAVLIPPVNDPLAPLPGAVNVTSTPLTGLLLASLTVATNGAAKAVLIVAFCGVPLVALIDAAAPATLVRAKVAGVAAPAAAPMV